MNNKQPLRIAHIIGKWVGGGVEAVVMNYYRHIDRTQIQFDFLCDNDSTNIPYDEIESLGGRIVLIPPYQKVLEYDKVLYKVFKENNYKIVHSHINTLSVFPLRVAKKAGIPIRIAHSHSTTNKKEWKKNLLKNMLRPFSKVYATHYMCCSELAGRWLFGDKTYDAGKVYLLNNAIDIDKFKYDEAIRIQKRKKLGINDDTFVIGHIGRFVEQKNHRFLIDIFNEVHKERSNSLLLLIGQGPLMDEMKDKVHSLGLDKSVLFLGQRSDVSDLYNVMDLFLFPSLYEGLGMVLIEAQINGLNCIASTEVPLKAKIVDNITFIDLKDSISKWSDLVGRYIMNTKRIDFTQLIQETTRCGFNIEEEKEKLMNYYKKIINFAGGNKHGTFN